MDAVAVYEAAGEAIARARDGAGPVLLECKTYRFFDHVGVRGMGVIYRTDDEVIEARKRDPIASLEAQLTESGIMTAEEIQSAHEAILAEIAEAVAFAESSPLPTEDDLLEDVYAGSR
jgi:pyruvate dehydrogenase E1 component alpha subunit